MKRLWIALALLCAVFVSTLLSSHYLKSFAIDLTGMLEQAEVMAEQGDWTGADRMTQKALDGWKHHNTYLYTMLRHADTDLVETSFREVQEFINCQEGGEYSAANARLIAQIELLYEMEQFTLINLL